MPSQIPCVSAINLHMSIMALSAVLVSASSRFLKLVHQSPFFCHVLVYCVLSTSTHSRDFPVFSPTTFYLRNLIIIMQTSSDDWPCSTLIRGSSLCNRIRGNEQRLQILKKCNCIRRTGTSTQQTASSKY